MNAQLDSPAVAALLSSIRLDANVSAGSASTAEGASPSPGPHASRNHVFAAQGTLLASLLDRLAWGVCLVDAAYRVVYANAAAESTIVQAFFPARAERAPEHEGGAERWIRAAISEALDGQGHMSAYEEGGRPLLLGFSPFRLSGGARAVLISAEREPGVADAKLSAYSRWVGLTRREAAVLGALTEGAEPREVALRLGVAVETVRTHIRALLRKAGAGGIRELIIKVHSAPMV